MMSRKTMAGMLFICLMSLNLRPFLTSITPLADGLMTELSVSHQAIALLTTIPMLLIGLLAFWGPKALDRFGAFQSLASATSLIALGLLARGIAHSYLLLVMTTVLCSIGVALLQSVLPAIIRRFFPSEIALMTGVYSLTLMGGGAIGAAGAAPAVAWLGSWNTALSFWAIMPLTALALLPWIMPRHHSRGPLPPIGILTIIRRPATLLLIGCFGLINGGYAITVTWLASYYQTLGYTVAATGNLLAITSVVQALSSLLCPIILSRTDLKLPVFIAILTMQIIGFLGLAFLPEAGAYFWILLLSAGLGGAFSVLMLFSLEQGRDAREGGYISAAMQGGGFIITAAAPWIASLIIDRTGSFPTIWIYQATCALGSAFLSLLIPRRHRFA